MSNRMFEQRLATVDRRMAERDRRNQELSALVEEVGEQNRLLRQALGEQDKRIRSLEAALAEQARVLQAIRGELADSGRPAEGGPALLSLSARVQLIDDALTDLRLAVLERSGTR